MDKGVIGTQAKKREGFMQMIKDAEKGDFDLMTENIIILMKFMEKVHMYIWIHQK